MDELIEYKCAKCGGTLVFDSNLQKLRCEFCGSLFTAEELKALQNELFEKTPEDYKRTETENIFWSEQEAQGIFSYICESCGGEIIGDATTAATSCPFCGNPVVMKGNLSGELRPQFVLPFKLDKAAAKKALKEHFKNKKLLPKVFSSENHLDEIKGVYVPYWLYDVDSDASSTFKCTNSSSWISGDYRYTETKTYNVARAGNMQFIGIPADGSKKMDDTLMESIEPYDYSAFEKFNAAYLAGFLADKYDVPKEDCAERIESRAKRSAVDALRRTVSGYASVTPQDSTVNLKYDEPKYGLLPVWLLHTSWNGEHYLFAMNGQTGKFVGDLPIDKKRYWMYFVRNLLIVGGIVAGALSLIMSL